MIRARLIDGRGTISVLVARGEPASPVEICPWDPTAFHIHASQPDDPVTMAARKLLGGSTVGLFDERGLTTMMLSQIEGIATALREIERRARTFEWSRASVADARIEGERGAIEWFIRSPTDVLIMGRVAFEKRAQPRPRPASGSRRTWASRGPVARAA